MGKKRRMRMMDDGVHREEMDDIYDTM